VCAHASCYYFRKDNIHGTNRQLSNDEFKGYENPKCVKQKRKEGDQGINTTREPILEAEKRARRNAPVTRDALDLSTRLVALKLAGSGKSPSASNL